MRYLILLVLFAIAGCADQHELAVCHGDLVALNPPHWQPTAAELAALNKVCPDEDKS